MLECNNLPLLDEVKEAEVRRIDVSPFESKFVSQERYDEIEDKTNLYVGNTHYATDEFRHKHKQALFEILRIKFAKYVSNGFKFSPTPSACKSKTRDYLAISDDIFEWVKETYQETAADDVEPLYVADMYERFKSSDCFRRMSKTEQRHYNKSNFETKVRSNLFLSKDFVDRDGYIGKTKIKKPALKHWTEPDYSTSQMSQILPEDDIYLS
jgi:phage/plasmid-associated DNA primase